MTDIELLELIHSLPPEMQEAIEGVIKYEQQLRAENARLRAALLPFAQTWEAYDDAFVAEDDHEYNNDWFSMWMGRGAIN